MTQGTFVGPLCSGDKCKCREGAGDGGAGVPTDLSKRFEVRLTSAQGIWMKIGQNMIYKDPERTEACWYVDLPAGDTQVEMRASDPNGVSGAWQIHELGTKTKSWYDTFSFNCGSPGVCSLDELDAQKGDLKDPKHDHCGSVKVRGLSWDRGRPPDGLHPSELLVRATLKVYNFVPSRPHGDDCSKKQDEERAEDNPKM